ncbi:hypothetical protein [Legionella oakridgensis]|uniref:hypothetical protein n=1 Tax=Legionella oakridgensis TaxID=29423 RepID=UPI0003DE6D8C|nr:hypothetical protein [Legionella oakridgensis]ETO94550.1 hypothetical protein LOR_10c01160 [Legionella oakridgensis RV-2-2007]
MNTNLASAVLILATLGILLGCVAHPHADPKEKIARSVYSSGKPASVSLITIKSNDPLDDHSALLIDGKQAVIFDPAGSFKSPKATKYDLIYGADPSLMQEFITHYVNENHNVVIQTKHVSPEIADALLGKVEHQNPVSYALCSHTISSILHQTTGFEQVNKKLLPTRTMQEFAKLTGVNTILYAYGEPPKEVTL